MSLATGTLNSDESFSSIDAVINVVSVTDPVFDLRTKVESNQVWICLLPGIKATQLSLVDTVLFK